MTAEPTKLSWNQSQCERCWIAQEGKWEPLIPGQDPHASDYAEILAEVRMPHRLTEPVLERCAWCGYPTIFGVYKRADPASVPFPAAET